VEEPLRDALDALLESPTAQTLVIDLRELAYMDSTGVQRLLAAQTGADERHRRLEVRLGPAARRILVLCGVLDRFTVTG
jgi:anti-anti-sigma factor